MANTFKEKAQLADAMEVDGYMYRVNKVEGDILYYSDGKANYWNTLYGLEMSDAQLFIKITDAEIATA